MEKKLRLSILGCRGSAPVSGDKYSKYGGSTSCYLVEALPGDACIIVDAGSGIGNMPVAGQKNIRLLITHPHIDHIIGLPVFSPLSDKECCIDIHLKAREGLSGKEQLDRFISRPLWPCRLEDYRATIRVHGTEQLSSLDSPIMIRSLESNHPGGSSIYRFDFEGKSIVLATDFEHDNTPGGCSDRLIEFAKNADILLYDAQYTDEEYASHRGFGHSTPSEGLKVKELSHAKRLIFVHHSPDHDDAFLDKLAGRYGEFAREGDVLSI